MTGTQTRLLRRAGLRCRAGLLVLITVLALLAGCATQQPEGPQPAHAAQAVQAPPASEGPSVVPLEDGRLGFMITEPAWLDDTARRDFETAVARLNEKAYNEAIDLLQAVIEQSPGVTAPHINLGMAYEQVGKQEQAETQFKAALELVPGHPVACNQYGLLCRKAGRFEEARTIYEQGLERFPDYYPLHRNLGILCDLYLDDLESALAHYEIYSEAMPDDKQVTLWIADVSARLGRN